LNPTQTYKNDLQSEVHPNILSDHILSNVGLLTKWSYFQPIN